MDNGSTTQPTADSATPSGTSSMALNKASEASTEKLAGEKSPLTDMPCITIPFKNNSASEQGQVNVNLTIKDSFNKTESQSPQTQPVFPDLLQRLQTQLTAHYTETSFVNKRLFDTDYFSLADYFVNLQVVVKAYERNEVTQSNDDKRSHKPLRERDRLVGKKEAIAPSDLFQPSAYQGANGKSSVSIDTVVVSGAAGVGKTTLIDYIAYQWALFKQGEGKEGLWSDFDGVLIIRCRSLRPEIMGPNISAWGITELLRLTCWNGLDMLVAEAAELLSRWREAPDKYLLLLDGLDELPMFEMDSPWHGLLKQLFGLPFKKLVTTRPYAVSNLRQWLSHDRLVEIQGFSDESVLTFFNKHLGATGRTNNFIKDIKQNPDLWAIVHIPINAYLLKTWWETTCQHDKPVLLSEMSVSDLYESLMVNVCRRYLAKIGELDENKLLDDEMVLEVPSIRCLLDTLGCWAFEGLRQDTAQLPISWLKGVQSSDESPTLLSENRLKQLNVPALRALGLLKQVGRAIKAHQRYEFLHLSFQEFLAANVIAVTLRQGTEEKKTHLTQVIHRYKYHPNFTLVWPSVAGLLSRYPTVLDDFLSTLVAGPKDWLGFVEFDLLMRCLESSLPSSTDTHVIGLQQQTLLRAVKQLIKRFNELPESWQQTTIDIFSMHPRLIRLNADTVLAFLLNQTVSGYFRGELAKSVAAYLPQTPECVGTVSVFLLDETVSGHLRCNLVRNAVSHLPLTPEFVDAVWALLRDEQLDGRYVRCDLVRSAVSHLPPTSEFVDTVWAFLRDEQVDGDVRSELARSAIAHLSQTPGFADAIWALLRNEKVSDSVRLALASSVVAYLPQTPECVHAVLLFLRDETVEDRVRGALAIRGAVYLPQTPECVDAVLAFLRDKAVDNYVRDNLARSVAAYFSQTPECVDAVLAFLWDETVEDRVRGALARSAVAHLSPTPELVDALLAFLRNETASDYIRGMLARSAVAHLPPTPELVDAVLAFLQDKAVGNRARGMVMKSVVTHLSKIPECMDAVLAFLRDETASDYYREDLAISVVEHLSQTPECVDAVLAFLQDEAVNEDVRGRVMKSIVTHLSPIPEYVDAVLAFLQDETLMDYFRCKLAKSAASYLSVDVVLAFVRDKTVSNYVRGELGISAVKHLSPTPELMDAVLLVLCQDKKVSEYFSGRLTTSEIQLFKQPNKVQASLDSFLFTDSFGGDLSHSGDIPVHLLLPLYKKIHDKSRQYIREQLVKHRVLVYEQASTVVVVQAGQTEQLALSQSIIQQIKQDLQPYRMDIDNSVSILSKLSLFSKSVMSFFSSQHTEKSSVQTSYRNIRRVMQ